MVAESRTIFLPDFASACAAMRFGGRGRVIQATIDWGIGPAPPKMQNLQSALGVFAILAIALAISENRRAVPWRPVVTGLGVPLRSRY